SLRPFERFSPRLRRTRRSRFPLTGDSLPVRPGGGPDLPIPGGLLMAEEPEGQEPEDEPQEDSKEPKTFDRDYVEKLRKEAASYRTKLKELEPLAKRAREL